MNTKEKEDTCLGCNRLTDSDKKCVLFKSKLAGCKVHTKYPLPNMRLEPTRLHTAVLMIKDPMVNQNGS